MTKEKTFSKSRRTRAAQIFCAALLAFISLYDAKAQEPPPHTTERPAQTNSSVATAADEYRIGAGDVIDIRVYNRPQLSREAVRVGGRGTIRMPLLDEEIQAACRTEAELAAEIARLYLKYQRRPHVDVFIKEYNSQPVAVIGAVGKPGRFQLQRRVRLLELISLAGGPTPQAGTQLQLVHAAESSTCEAAREGATDEGDAQKSVSFINLEETLRGGESANPFVRPGDVVTLPEADQVFVVGNVYKPTAIPLKEEITVSRAVAMAGGALPASKLSRVRVMRQQPGASTQTEIIVDLEAINKREATDLALKPNDVVDIPTSTGKRILRSLVGVISPTLSQIPVRAIP